MKKLIVAAIAAMFACAVHAADKPAASSQEIAMKTTMSAEECNKAMEECKKTKDEKTCKEELKSKGCKFE